LEATAKALPLEDTKKKQEQELKSIEGQEDKQQLKSKEEQGT
jgi:hypothetical protein